MAQDVTIQFKGNTRNLDRATARVQKNLKRVEKSMFSVTKVAGIAAAALATIGGAKIIQSTIQTIRTFEDLKNTLITIEGDAVRAAESMKLIEDFTAGTTFQLAEVTNAFITFKNAGLKPTTEFMTNVGNIAAGMGKRIDEVARAVFNATTGEFEMLKQLGIKVKTEGDKLTVNFRGVATQIDNDGQSIIDFIEKIGQTEFSGALERSANTLTGALSNLQDNVGLVQKAFGDGGFRDASTDFVKFLQDAVIGSKGLAKELGKEVGFAIFQTTKFLKEINFDMGNFIQAGKIAVAVLGGAGLIAVLKGVAGGIKAITLAMARNPLGLLAVAAASLITYLSMENGLGKTIAQVTAVMRTLGEMAGQVAQFFADKLAPVMDFLTSAFDGFIEGVQKGYNAIARFVPFLDEVEVSGKRVRTAIKSMAVGGFEYVAGKVEVAKDAVTDFIDTNQLAQDAIKSSKSVLDQLTQAWVDSGLTYEQATAAAREQYEAQYKLNEVYDDHILRLGRTKKQSQETEKAVVKLTQKFKDMKKALMEGGAQFDPSALQADLDELAKVYESAKADILSQDFKSEKDQRNALMGLETQYLNEKHRLNEDFNRRKESNFMKSLERQVLFEKKAINEVMTATNTAELQRIGQQEKQQAIFKKRVEFEKKSEAEKYQFFIGQAGDAFEQLGRYNKQAFEASKALRIAEAIMATYQAATLALATYPPPFGFIGAAIAVAAGLANVATIRSQTYSGRQLGGPVQEGKSFLVGETGPEIFTPNISGRIDRMDSMGGQPVNINFNIQAVDTQGFDELLVSRRGVIQQVISDAMLESGQRSRF